MSSQLPSPALISQYVLDVLKEDKPPSLIYKNAVFSLDLSKGQLSQSGRDSSLLLGEYLMPLTPTLEAKKILSVDSSLVAYVELPVNYQLRETYTVDGGYCDGKALYIYNRFKRCKFPLPEPVTPATALTLIKLKAEEFAARHMLSIPSHVTTLGDYAKVPELTPLYKLVSGDVPVMLESEALRMIKA